jgi:hypothetical protein
MLSRERFALVDDFAAINAVLEHQVERATRQRPPSIQSAVGGLAHLADDAGRVELLFQNAHRS